MPGAPRTPATVTPVLRQTEAQFQRAVIELAVRHGWRVAHFADSRKQIRGGRLVGDRQAAGFPDLVLARERVVFAELKGERTRETAEQVKWLDALELAGAEVYCWRPAHWPGIETVLARRDAMPRGP